MDDEQQQKRVEAKNNILELSKSTKRQLYLDKVKGNWTSGGEIEKLRALIMRLEEYIRDERP